MPTQTLDLKQSLQLRLNQRMQQAIKLLQMSNQDVHLFVQDYVQGNPLLDLETDYDDHDAPSSPPDEWALDEPLFDTATSSEDQNNHDFLMENEDNLTNLWPDHETSSDFSEKRPLSSRTNTDHSFDPLTLCVAPSLSFRSFLISQIDMVLPHHMRSIAYSFCDLLTEEGYLNSTWEQDISDLHPSFSRDEIDGVLTSLQTFEPTGIFARSLKECLIIQLRHRLSNEYKVQSVKGEKDSVSQTEIDFKQVEIILDALAQHKGSPEELAKRCRVTQDYLLEILSMLRTLNPRPASAFGEQPVRMLVPDILMRHQGQDDWVIELNPHTLPHVYLNSIYYTELRQCMKNSNEKSFLYEKYTEAKWLLKSLHQRAMNILKVTDFLIRKQMNFLKSHQGTLHPLTLKDVALATDLSESTVSRVTTDKYIQTPRGIFELKYFFSVSVSQQGSESIHSAKTIQHHIQKMITLENPSDPLSDYDIVERLKLHDIVVARRTVAKYRSILNIENASNRAKYYKWNQRDDKILAIRRSL